jgi:hypothetical protein
MDGPIRRKGEVLCVVIGSDRDWVKSGGGIYIYIFIYIVAGCSHVWKNVHDGRKGSQTLRTGTKYSLGGIEWQRRRLAVFA